jgi:hypothetical protein
MVFKLNAFAGHPQALQALLGPQSKIDADKLVTLNATIPVKYKSDNSIGEEERLLIEMLAKLENFKRLTVVWNTLHGAECAGRMYVTEGGRGIQKSCFLGYLQLGVS